MKVSKLLSVIEIAVIAFSLFCSFESIPTKNPPVTPVVGAQIVLNNNSSVISSIKIGGLSQDTIIIDSGTTILQLDTDKNYIPIASTSELRIALNSGDTATSLVPAGMKKVASFGLSATIDGKNAELIFVPSTKTNSALMPYTGVHWVTQISDTGIHSGTTLSLYKVSSLNKLVLIGSKVINTPVKVLPKIQQSSQNTDVSPDGTGNFTVNYYYQPICTSNPSKIPTGIYWTVFSSIPETTYVVGTQTYGGPLFVGSVSIGEPSTAELMADLCFADGVNCVTYINPNDKVQYWAERTQDAQGKTTSLKIASTAANIPYLNLILYSATTGTTILFVYGLKPDGGVVNSPDGSVLNNPYQDPQLKIGGAKMLNFRVKDFKDGQKTKSLFDGTGYKLFNMRYNRGIYSFTVSDTNDGRVLLEENVLSKGGWSPIKSLTTGNLGYYENRDTITLNITSHAKVDSVSTQKILLKGTIDNPVRKTAPISDILISYSCGTQNQQVHATLSGDSTFTAELNLYTGTNIIVFVPTVKNTSGENVTYSKHVLKAKDVETQYLMIDYEANWIGKFELTKKITTRTEEPDSSITVYTTSISANLKMNFSTSKLYYIKESHENAVTCSELNNCYLFSGSKDGPVSISTSIEAYSKNCKNELPLISTYKGSGSTALESYNLSVSVTLTPWDSTDLSTDRRYHLSVNANPHFAIHTDKNWPKAQSQRYDCATESWLPDSGKIGPNIKIDEAIFKFTNSQEVEAYSESPTTAKAWSFQSTVTSEDGLAVEEYSATLSVQP
ncbi:MAG TPA: hypothetical protein VHP36_04870 [Chitinispirillaceae bacterium]|nr:hypothetical protein [Chitinispirillaceae bacterium]